MAVKASGFITLRRQILDWEWYKDTSTFVLFVHLLLTANFTEGRFEGKTIQRGQLVTSLPSLSAGTGLSIQQVRTALKKLISTGEITDEPTNRYRIITISKYSDYQEVTDKPTDNQQTTNRQLTGQQQTINRQSTDNQQQYNNNNNNNKNNKGTTQQGRVSASRFIPPTREDIFDFCLEEGISLDVDRFFDYYSAQGWKLSNGNAMKDWRAAVRQWVSRDRKKEAYQAPVKKVPAQQYSQRDYSTEQDDALQRMIAEMMRGGNEV